MTVHYVDIVATLAVAQYLFFGSRVGAARHAYGIKAPAVVGHEIFERTYRVQMNTLELMVALLPLLYAASRYWPEWGVAAVGTVYLVGRTIYWRAYVKEPSTRSLGFILSVGTVITLAFMTLVPAVLGRGPA
jgi:hypothetical protein